MLIHYAAPGEPASERTVRPLGLYFWRGVWTLAAWCELRAGFRNFRLDRIESSTLGEPFPANAATSLEAILAAARTERPGR